MNVIQIVCDSTRVDFLGYNGGWVRTPNIDRLAGESCVFDFAMSESLPTVPVRRALSTTRRTFPYKDGPQPKGITNSRYGWRPIPEEHITVAEHLDPLGYTKGMVIDVYHLMKPAMNFHRFFHSYQWIRGQEADRYRTGKFDYDILKRYTNLEIKKDNPRLKTLVQYLRNQQGRTKEEEYQAGQVFGAAAQWVEDNAEEEKFFLWVDSFSPHPAWYAPKRYMDMYDPDYDGLEVIFPGAVKQDALTDREIEHMRCCYAATLSFVDAGIGKLLNKIDECGLRENTLVMLLSDHGYMVGDYNREIGMASKFVRPEIYRIMCMMRHPEGIGAGRRVASPVYNIDLIHTMLEVIGAGPIEGSDSTGLWPLITGEKERVHDYLISAQHNYESVWEEDWLYYRNEEQEWLHDRKADPAQENNLAKENEAKCREMAERLDAYLKSKE
ncbi:MAG: sulfatase-like hydrolase/transferase [Planctomycetes bacterium]|nr:sulfatase-like hydrolase/transferase [Planctomycetota bacterium]